MAQQHHRYSQTPSVEDDIYYATPQHTGVSDPGPAMSRWTDAQRQHRQQQNGKEQTNGKAQLNGDAQPNGKPRTNGETAALEDEERPALPPPPESSDVEHNSTPMALVQQPSTYHRSKERVMAYMIPLPRPRWPDGEPINVPLRFMLYLPPAADHIKPPADSGIDERKRDKIARKWQKEVRKAKTYSGRGYTFSGMYSATVRGALWCLKAIQRSELTFLSRLPRKTLKELTFVHPEGEGLQNRRRFELIKQEFHRNKFVAKRDFWIGAALFPVAQGVDMAIPVGGGFSEVCAVWMIITGRAWLTASGMMKRLVYNDGYVGMRPALTQEPHHSRGAGEGAAAGDDSSDESSDDSDDSDADSEDEESDDGDGSDDDENENEDEGADDSEDDEDEEEDEDEDELKANANGNSKPSSRWRRRQKKPKKPKPFVETVFRPSARLDPLARYLQAACHARNPAAFLDIDEADTTEEEDVLHTIGWTPTQRGELELPDAEAREADRAWQVRQATEDLRISTEKAAKRWNKFCKAYVKNPERTLRRERRQVEKMDRKEAKERMKKEGRKVGWRERLANRNGEYGNGDDNE